MEWKVVKILILFSTLGFALTCEEDYSFLCEGVPINNYVRNVTACNAWIQCKENGVIVPGFCEDSLFFDQEKQSCVTIENANCYSCPVQKEHGYYPVENSCNRYIRCLQGVATEHICSNGKQFNPLTSRCEFGVNCEISFKCPQDLGPEGFYAFHDPSNCSM